MTSPAIYTTKQALDKYLDLNIGDRSMVHDVSAYMTEGAGRIFSPDVIHLLRVFFQDQQGHIDASNALQQALSDAGVSEMSLSAFFGSTHAAAYRGTVDQTDAKNIEGNAYHEIQARSFTSTSMRHWKHGLGDDDYFDRAYVYGTTGFFLDNDLTKLTLDANDRLVVSQLAYVPDPNDNFDFTGGSPGTDIFNGAYADDSVAAYPSAIPGQTIHFEFDGDPVIIQNYGINNYAQDRAARQAEYDADKQILTDFFNQNGTQIIADHLSGIA